MSINLKIFWALALAVVFFVPFHFTFAHTDMSAASPAPHEIVRSFPETIQITFSEPVTNGSVKLSHNNQVYALSVVEQEPASQITGKPNDSDFDEGTYQVLWSAVSADGGAITGSYSFIYDAPTSYTFPIVIAVGLIALLPIGIFLHRKQRL